MEHNIDMSMFYNRYYQRNEDTSAPIFFGFHWLFGERLWYKLGSVDEFIDYTTTPITQVSHKVDVVFDTVGGDTAYQLLDVSRPGGRVLPINLGNYAPAQTTVPMWPLVQNITNLCTRMARS